MGAAASWWRTTDCATALQAIRDLFATWVSWASCGKEKLAEVDRENGKVNQRAPTDPSPDCREPPLSLSF